MFIILQYISLCIKVTQGYINPVFRAKFLISSLHLLYSCPHYRFEIVKGTQYPLSTHHTPV